MATAVAGGLHRHFAHLGHAGPGRPAQDQLFALCDRGTDLADCIAMAPTTAELADAEPWLAEQDAKPMWPDHVRATLDDLRGRLGHGV